jgi:hypothetical protein
MSDRSDIIDISGEKRGETEKAIRWFDGKQTVWLPKSQIEVNDDGTVSLPEWLAREKGLI